MADAINLRLESARQGMDPESFLGSIRSFLAILRNLDSAVSRDSRGSIYWEIGHIQRTSPTVVAFNGESQRSDVDFTPKVQDLCINGLRQLDEIAERPADYSDATLSKVRQLANYLRPHRRRRLASIEVYQGEAPEYSAYVQLSPRLTTNIVPMLEVRYDSMGSVVGNLDSVSIHAGTEFRVWEEITGRPVTCHFEKAQLEMVRSGLGQRVLVHGQVRANAEGQPVRIEVAGIEPYPSDSDLPSIEEMSGLIADFTGGVPLGEYMNEVRDG